MKYLSLLFAALCVSTASAQQHAAVQLEADAAIFRYDANRQIWEWSYAFPDSSLTYQPRNGQLVGQMYFRMTLKDTAGVPVTNEEWIVANSSDVARSSAANSLIGVKKFALSPGKYKVDCVVADMAYRQDSLRRTFAIVIGKPINDKPALSDIQLASSIGMSAEGDNPAYSKGPVTVVPNPSGMYVVAPPASEDTFDADAGILLPYYFEVYNTKTTSPSGIALHYSVLNSAKQTVMDFTQQRDAVSDEFAVYGNVPLEALASGLYYFSVKMNGTGDAAGDSVVSQKKFYVLNPAKPATQTATYMEGQEYEMSEFATMGPESLQEEYDKIKPLLAPSEQDKFKMLTEVAAQRKYLFRFWKERDPDPQTADNPARQDFQNLITYANTYFTTSHTPGWRTDRGRVLRQYGKPDKIDVSPYSTDAKPNTTWRYYYLQGGADFCFVELNGVDYTLVHSTAPNELSEPQWYKRYAEIMGPAQFHR